MTSARRVFLIVLDSLGVGALPDAARFGDDHAHTLDHLVQAAGPVQIPRLLELGLGSIPGVESLPSTSTPRATVARLAELSAGKDTSTGHWEMMGVVIPDEFPTYPEGFPDDLIATFVEANRLPGVLCNRPLSGTVALDEYGAEHIASGRPIVYTSADSVFQIAAHEEAFGLERLYEVCRNARAMLDPLGVGRVIARPFVGAPGSFQRTYNRKDYSLTPPGETSLDRLATAGVPVIGIGKIEDIFAGRGVSVSHHTEGNSDGMRVLTECGQTESEGLVFINLVDFDMLYGHRRDPAGYARALEAFDRELLAFEETLRPDDIVILTADHGNDPTHTTGTDHTREYVPMLAYGPRTNGRSIGTRRSFADVGATVETLFGLTLPADHPGSSFATELLSA